MGISYRCEARCSRTSGCCGTRRYRLQLRMNQTANAISTNPTMPAPTPIPAWAPTDRPLEAELPVGEAAVEDNDVETAVACGLFEISTVFVTVCPGPAKAPQAVGSCVSEDASLCPGGLHPTPFSLLPLLSTPITSVKQVQPSRQHRPMGALVGQ